VIDEISASNASSGSIKAKSRTPATSKSRVEADDPLIFGELFRNKVIGYKRLINTGA
jgi:hypothetical protein